MADRRMLSKAITESDDFLDMPLSAQALYMHLSMSADDDGFVDGPKKTRRMVGASDEDFQALVDKGYVIMFDSGVAVIRHWRAHNYIRSDRYKKTIYTEELAMLYIDENRVYHLGLPSGIPSDNHTVDEMETQVRLGKDRLDKCVYISAGAREETPEDQEEDVKTQHGENGHVLLTDKEEQDLVEEYGREDATAAIAYLDMYIQEKGSYNSQSHYTAIKRWVMDAVTKKRHRSRGRQRAAPGGAILEHKGTDYGCLERQILANSRYLGTQMKG